MKNCADARTHIWVRRPPCTEIIRAISPPFRYTLRDYALLAEGGASVFIHILLGIAEPTVVLEISNTQPCQRACKRRIIPPLGSEYATVFGGCVSLPALHLTNMAALWFTCTTKENICAAGMTRTLLNGGRGR
ncbi:hypothetical protein [Escherichia coli]|uniref:hypothetical protein n=1 Tax=Escherichia coli TaxID=562 RepID=UPI0022710367|nr:hypothetical protein [Escherichia coli]MCY0139170.1 hypothetical protein [Escherichia coli]